MLALVSQLSGQPIMSLRGGIELGQLDQPIIDPRNLKLAAFYVTGPRINHASALHSEDIREISGLGVIVNDAEDIMEIDSDLVRLNEILEFNFNLVGKIVTDETGRKIGRITDYAVNDQNFMVSKLHVSQSIMKNFNETSMIIDRSQVIEMTDEKVVVRSAAIKKTDGLFSAITSFKLGRASD